MFWPTVLADCLNFLNAQNDGLFSSICLLASSATLRVDLGILLPSKFACRMSSVWQVIHEMREFVFLLH